MSASWLRIGRFFAWLAAVCLALNLVVGLVFAGVGAADPSRTTSESTENRISADSATDYFVQQRAALGSEYPSQVLRFIGFLALIPVGRALREYFGREGGFQELCSLAFTIGGIFGALQALLALGFSVWTTALSRTAPTEALVGLALATQVWSGVATMLLNGFFVLVGSGLVLGAWLGLALQRMPSRWSLVGVVAGLLFWLSAIVQLVISGIIAASGVGVATAAVLSASQLLPELVLSVLLPLWCFWLARELSRHIVDPD
jgi:hypothetical protein